jgi:hypothetical protein
VRSLEVFEGGHHNEPTDNPSLCVEFCPTRPKKVQEPNSPTPQCLLQGQQLAIISRSPCRTGCHPISEARESSHCMFGIIVVPWDVVKIEKCEKPVPIFLDSLLQ